MWLSEAAVPIEVDIKLNNSGRSTGTLNQLFLVAKLIKGAFCLSEREVV